MLKDRYYYLLERFSNVKISQVFPHLLSLTEVDRDNHHNYIATKRNSRCYLFAYRLASKLHSTINGSRY